MDIHFFVTSLERFYNDSLACSVLPILYPGCNYFWLTLGLSAILFLSVICFLATRDLVRQISLYHAYEHMVNTRSPILCNEVMQYSKWKSTNPIY